MTALASEINHRSVADMSERLHGYVRETPISYYDSLGRNITLLAKDEGQQVTNSFKARGAMAKLLELQDEGVAEVVTASAGNHASGVAYGVNTLDMRGTIFVPEGTPLSKLNMIKAMGGTAIDIVIAGQNFDASYTIAQRHSRHDRPFVEPFDDLTVIQGQGTAAREVLLSEPHTRRLFVPIGGGGLFAGSLQAVEEAGVDVDVVGVQLETNTSAEQSWVAGRQTEIIKTDKVCEGSAVRKIGMTGLEIMQRHDNLHFVTVTRRDVGEECVRLDRQRQQLAPVLGQAAFDHFPETTALIAAAGARKFAREHPEIYDETWVTLLSGANTDSAKEQLVVEAYQESQRLLTRRTQVWR